MKQLFLTSSVHAVAHDIAKKQNLSKANKLVFIDTAAEVEEGDKTWLKNDRQALITAGFSVGNYTITDKSKNQLESELSGFDYIYLSGGNTAHLLYESQKSGFIPVIKELVENEGKIYIGTSAGSIIAGPKLPDYLIEGDVVLENKDGYNFVNFTIVPHWGSKDFKEEYLGKRLEIAYEKNHVPLLLLRDNQYIDVKDDRIKIVDVKN